MLFRRKYTQNVTTQVADSSPPAAARSTKLLRNTGRVLIYRARVVRGPEQLPQNRQVYGRNCAICRQDWAQRRH